MGGQYQDIAWEQHNDRTGKKRPECHITYRNGEREIEKFIRNKKMVCHCEPEGRGNLILTGD